MERRVVAVLATVVVASLGAALGVALAGPSTKTTNRVVTVAGRVTVRARTITQVLTVQRLRTTVKTVTVHAPPASVAVVSGASQGASAQAGSSPGLQRFSGTGAHVLGTIVVSPPGTTLRWTASGGRFRLLFNGTGVAADSTALSGEIAVPPLTYQQVTVETTGRWTIQIG